MTDTAVIHTWFRRPSKRDLLLFDRVGVIGLEASFSDLPARVVADLEYLAVRDVIFEPELIIGAGVTPDELQASVARNMVAIMLAHVVSTPHKIRDIVSREFALAELAAAPVGVHVDRDFVADVAADVVEELLERFRELADVKAVARRINDEDNAATTRMFCRSLHASHGIETTPIIPDIGGEVVPSSGHIDTVAQVVLTQLPEPDDTVSLEQILDFRADDQARASVRRLRHWMSRIASTPSTPRAVLEEMQYLLSEYEESMRFHKMKINRGTLETLLTTSAEVIDGLLSFKLTNAIKPLFVLTERRIALLEAERAAPGREVAYVAAVRTRFHGGA